MRPDRCETCIHWHSLAGRLGACCHSPNTTLKFADSFCGQWQPVAPLAEVLEAALEIYDAWRCHEPPAPDELVRLCQAIDAARKAGVLPMEGKNEDK